MATLVFTNAYVWVNNVDLSDHADQVTINYRSETPDATTFGVGTRVNKGGLKDWDVEIRFQQDFAAAKVDATLFALVGATACFEIRPFNTCTTQSNPSYTSIGVLESYPPVAGAVGDVLRSPARFVAAAALGRASSS